METVGLGVTHHGDQLGKRGSATRHVVSVAGIAQVGAEHQSERPRIREGKALIAERGGGQALPTGCRGNPRHRPVDGKDEVAECLGGDGRE